MTTKGMLAAKVLAAGLAGTLVAYTVTAVTLGVLSLWLAKPVAGEKGQPGS